MLKLLLLAGTKFWPESGEAGRTFSVIFPLWLKLCRRLGTAAVGVVGGATCPLFLTARLRLTLFERVLRTLTCGVRTGEFFPVLPDSVDFLDEVL